MTNQRSSVDHRTPALSANRAGRDPFDFVSVVGAPPAHAGPYRQIARLAHELHFNGLANLDRISPRRFERGVVLMLIARCCLADWVRGEALEPPAQPTIFASVNSLAASLGRPYETVRGQVQALVANNLCVAGPDGVAPRASPDAAPRIVAFLTATHDAFLRFSEDVARWIDLPLRTGVGGERLARVLKPALDVQLAPFEILRTVFNDWTTQMVFAVVAGGCVRHITIDPVLSARYAEDLPPDDARRPVTMATLQAVTGLPYSTLSRYVRRLQADKLLIRKDTGWIVGADYLRAPGIQQGTRAAAAFYCRRVSEALSGLEGAGDAYLRERPALVSFDAT